VATPEQEGMEPAGGQERGLRASFHPLHQGRAAFRLRPHVPGPGHVDPGGRTLTCTRRAARSSRTPQSAAVPSPVPARCRRAFPGMSRKHRRSDACVVAWSCVIAWPAAPEAPRVRGIDNPCRSVRLNLNRYIW